MKTIPLQQPTDLLRRNVTFSKKVVFGTAKTLSQLVLGNTGIATNEFLNILDAMGLSQNPSELAWELVFKSLFTGIKNLLAENTLLTLDTGNNHISTEQTHQLSTLTFQITEYLQTNNVDNANSSNQTNLDSPHSINQDFFSKPNQAPVITGFANRLEQWLASLGVHPTDTNNFANRYGDYVALAFCDIWRSDAAKYQKLLDTSTPADKNAQEIMNWRLYRQKLQHVVQTPIFNETISLQQLFIELRASYIDTAEFAEAEENEIDSTNIRIHERNTKHKVVMLNEHIEHWYQQDDKKDAIRLLCGGPGSGKSSSAKIIAANFAKKGERVVFLPLHHLRFNDDFDKVIDEHLASVDRLGMPLFNDNDFAKTLVIFDGLDELAMQGKSAENDAKAFVNWLKNKVASLNEFKLRIKVLLTGRDVIIQQQQHLSKQAKKTPCHHNRGI